MKTWLWIIGITILIGGSAALAFGAYKMFTNTGGEHSKSVLEAKGAPSAKDKEKEFKEQTRKVNGITFDLKVDFTSSENEVIVAMHKMTHQKVKAEDKWGAIPMIPDTINKIHEILIKSDFKRKDDLLEIVERWKNGDFSSADDDHNYFWDYQNGTVGEAYGVMNEVEEREFIINNFGEEYLPESFNE